MTFTLHRRHPGNTFSGQRILHNLKDNLPFTVDVEGPIPRTDYAATCKCTEVYRINAESVSWLRKNEMLRKGLRNNPCVCACQGVLGGEVVDVEKRGYRSHYRKLK